MFNFLFKKEENKKIESKKEKSISKNKTKLHFVNKETILLKKHNMIIYYNILLKYPSLVIEIFKSKPKNIGIIRSQMGEPFGPDPLIPLTYQYTKDEYINYSKHGGSYGHNAAAFIHKDGIENYKSTYLFTNICPQEVVFNSGLWLLFEGISEEILNKYNGGMIINGSIKGKDRIFNGSKINVPSHMFKIIIYQDKKMKKNEYVCFVAKNKPYYIDEDIKKYKNQKYDLSKYTMDLNAFQKKFGLTLMSKQMSLEKGNEDSIMANQNRVTQMENAALYGKIIYAKNESELNKVAPNPDKLPEFHKIYYGYKKEYFSKNPNVEKMERLLNQSITNPIF